MAISPEDFPTEADERVLRMYNLQVEIEKGRAATERLRQEIRTDSRKFTVQALLALAASISAGVAAGAYLERSRTPATPQPLPPPQVIIIQAPPGTTASVAPPAK